MSDYVPPRIKVGDEQVIFRPLKSKRFCCAMCLDFVIEHTPVVKQEMIKTFIATNGIPQVKLECPRGCSRSQHWHFYDINDPKTRARY